MESPRIHGGSEEEKSSCESGWTMYIEDTFHDNHHSDVVYEDYDDDGDDHRVKQVDDEGDDDDDDGGDSSDDKSDDSMTSDASSWPSTQLPRNTTKNHAATKNNTVKQVDHQTKNRVSDEGEESELKARTRTTATSRVQSKGKVKKTK